MSKQELFNYGQDIVMAFSPPVVGCLVKKCLQKGRSRAPQDPPLPVYALEKARLIKHCKEHTTSFPGFSPAEKSPGNEVEEYIYIILSNISKGTAFLHLGVTNCGFRELVRFNLNAKSNG